MTRIGAVQVAQQLAENESEPYGRARTARAEQLVEPAAQTGDRPLLISALSNVIQCYEFGGEGDRVLVPFARLLKLWDEDAAAFDDGATYGLHWYFKWVSSGMIQHPNVPLSTVLRWTDEMASRYRQAGYGMHAVHSVRHSVAAHIGDLDAAARAFDDWTTSDRDVMSDCHACEGNQQGDWHRTLGNDERALAAWSPVLRGDLTCAEEPHRLLAHALMPLARLGRWDEARAHHLRGYRMVRRNPNLRSAVGRHIEFAALTGNEARALEIVAEHADWLESSGENVLVRMAFLEGVAVALRRLAESGHGELPVTTSRGRTASTPAQELLGTVEAEVALIAARFDERNGTSAVSERSRTRLAAEPLATGLPLGARLAGHPVRPVRPVPRAADPGPPDRTVDELVAEAQRLTAAHHPGAHDAWEAVAATGADLPPGVVARIHESRARSTSVDDRAERDAFADVVQRFTAAGEPARATVSRARAGLAAVRSGEPSLGVREATDALDEIRRLRSQGQAEESDVLLVRVIAAGARLLDAAPRDETDEQTPAAERYATVRQDLAALADDAEAAGIHHTLGFAASLLARVHLAGGDDAAARQALSRAVSAYLAADAPWSAAEPLLLLAELAMSQGEVAQAEELALEARRHGGELLDDEVAGQLAGVLADAAWAQPGREGDVVAHALEGAARLDRDAPDAGARARVLAAMAFRRQGRPGEAAALLEAALPALEEHAEEEDVVNARRQYGLCLIALGEHRDASQALLQAAAVAQGWPHQEMHAALAHEAGEALEGAGLPEQAESSYRRAAELWAGLGAVASGVRARRAAAWSMVKRPDRDRRGALATLDGVEEDLARVLGERPSPGAADADDASEVAAELRHERWETLRQIADFLRIWPDDEDPPASAADRALAAADAAATGFAELGDTESANKSQLLAAEIEGALLDRPLAGARRVRAVREASRDRGETDWVEYCDDVLDWLDPGDETAGETVRADGHDR